MVHQDLDLSHELFTIKLSFPTRTCGAVSLASPTIQKLYSILPWQPLFEPHFLGSEGGCHGNAIYNS